MGHANDSREIVDRLQFRVLGPIQVLGRDGSAIDVGGSKPRLVLVQLLLSPNRVVATDALVDAVWGEDPPPTARRSLQSHVAKLRAALGGSDGPVRSQPPGYLLTVDEAQIDLWRSEDLVHQARASLLSNPRQAYSLARQARKEWIGEPLADLAAHDQLIPQRRRLDRLWLDLVELELDAELAIGDTAAALERLEALMLDRPEHEPFWARLMTAYYRLGRQSEALAAFQRARESLLDAFGIDPSPELQRLEMAILGQAAELIDVKAQICPYKGLASYQLDDADLFYGRDELVAELVEAVRTASFVVVVGSSGAGKSSALRAGLVKAVQARKVGDVRQACVVTPGTAPLRSIYQVSRSADVVIVAQFEELFTLTDDEATHREFVRLLLARVNDGDSHVVISLRADFYGHCTKIPELAPLLARRQVVVGPLSEQELRVVITKPAENAGLAVTHELVDSIVAEAANRPGSLPLVSHALVETWHRRAGNQLTLEAYREAGSIAAAIARTAERVYDSFQSVQRVQAERLFLRLVEPGDGTEHARRTVPYGQLEGSSIDREVVDLLVEARLLTAAAEGLEIAHEALIAAWPRLRTWIDDDRDGIRTHRHLTSAASAWAELGHDEGELYRGARLSAALSWIADTTPDLSDLERDFIDAGVGMSETQLRQQVRANRRLKILVAASIVGVVVAAIGIVQAASQAKKADRGRAEAEAAQLVVSVRGQPNLSASAMLQLAVEADRRASTPATKGLLLDAIAQVPGVTAGGNLGVLLTGNAPISSNGGVLVGIDDSMLGVVLDATTLEPRSRTLRPAPTVVVDTGSRLLGVMGTGLTTVDLETGEAVGPPPGLAANPSQVALSPDGTTLAVANGTNEPEVPQLPAVGATVRERAITLFDVASGRPRLTVTSGGGASFREVTFSPDGRYVLAVASGIQAVVWDATTGQEVFASSPSATAGVTRLAMSPSGRLIALGRENGKVEMWRSDDGLHWPSSSIVSPHRDRISWIDFDSQSQRMVSTSSDGMAVVWDAATGEIVAGPHSFRSDGGSTTFFRPDSATSLVNMNGKGDSWKWEPPHGGLLTTVVGVNLGATVSASPQTSVMVSEPSGATVYDPSVGALRQVGFTSGKQVIRGIAGSANGKRFVVLYSDGHLELRDEASGNLVVALARRVSNTGDVMIALDRGGTRVAFQTDDEQIVVVDDHGTTVHTISLSSQQRNLLALDHLQALDLSADGRELVVSTNVGEAIWYNIDGPDTTTLAPPGDGFDAQFVSGDRVAFVGKSAAHVLDPRSRQTMSNLPVGADSTRLAVDGTGRLWATADATGSIQLWDAVNAVRIGASLHVRNASSAVPIHFSVDGHYLLVSGPQETTWIDVSTAVWPRIACSLVIDRLSSVERAQYLGSSGTPETCA